MNNQSFGSGSTTTNKGLGVRVLGMGNTLHLVSGKKGIYMRLCVFKCVCTLNPKRSKILLEIHLIHLIHLISLEADW